MWGNGDVRLFLKIQKVNKQKNVKVGGVVVVAYLIWSSFSLLLTIVVCNGVSYRWEYVHMTKVRDDLRERFFSLCAHCLQRKRTVPWIAASFSLSTNVFLSFLFIWKSIINIRMILQSVYTFNKKGEECRRWGAWCSKHQNVTQKSN